LSQSYPVAHSEREHPETKVADAAQQLDLRPGEWVEVRTESEILATLDDEGTLDGLPFMPEMLWHCGRRYEVFKRADKTCDTINWTGLRRMERTVHLKMLRCDGSAHGGCQAGCLMFWNEAWLRRVPEETPNAQPSHAEETRIAAEIESAADARSAGNGEASPNRDRDWLEARVYRVSPAEGETAYRCQATELVKASCPLRWWEPKQYVRDVCMNHVPLGEVIRGVAVAAFSKVHRKLTGRTFPSVAGPLKKTPVERLDLQAGEWVIVKSKDEILPTLDGNGRNRGMTFDAEMLPYCGKRFRVLRRVERIVQETTGRLIELGGVAVILENVVCTSRYRRSCPRSIYSYWREIWLRRADPDETPE
jgi:hypothetical protein